MLEISNMPTLANLRADPPRGWDEFEDIVCSAAKNRWKNEDFTRHGRQGQSQHGVDVYGMNNKGQMIGLQCKNTCSGVTMDTVNDEVKIAETFKPPLFKLYIATTAPTDSSIQESVRLLSEKRKQDGQFEVGILFWNDIWHDLSLHEERAYQHYPHLRPKLSTTPQVPSHDQRLFQEFQSIFSFEPAVRLLREQDFGAPFPRRSIQPLFDFVETWGQPEKEFLDQELQFALADLYSAACKMSNHLTNKTVPIGNQEYASVFSDQERAAGPRSDWVKEEARVLNEQANIFVPIYEQFLRLCRSKLLRS